MEKMVITMELTSSGVANRAAAVMALCDAVGAAPLEAHEVVDSSLISLAWKGRW
jgi:hypothetical protein